MKQDFKEKNVSLLFYLFLHQANEGRAYSFCTGINPVLYWSFLLFYVPERGRRQDGESCGENYKLI